MFSEDRNGGGQFTWRGSVQADSPVTTSNWRSRLLTT
jgi:hypothetical protein